MNFTQYIIMKDLTNQRTALQSLFKHLKNEGFAPIKVEPTDLEEGEEVLEIKEETTFDEIFDFYFVYDADYILTVRKNGWVARILQTWWGGVEGLYSDASCSKAIFDDLERASEKWYEEMERKEIQWN